MSKWEEFKSTEAAKPPSRRLGGTFVCQNDDCGEYVQEADYFYTDYVLKWKCSNGHVSFAEDFKL